MGVFEEMSRFLEERLEEFLQAHPTLELQVLEDQIQEQQAELQRVLRQLTTEEKQLQEAILTTAAEVQRWHERVKKAEAAHRDDLAQAAREREAALLRQGNQQWAQMELAKQQIQQTQSLVEQLMVRRQDVQARIRQQRATQQRPPTPEAWQSSTAPHWPPQTKAEVDPLEATFQRWETDAELEALKRQMGR